MKTSRKRTRHAWVANRKLDGGIGRDAELTPLIKVASFVITAGLMIASCCLI